jgi:hypothetical protein
VRFVPGGFARVVGRVHHEFVDNDFTDCDLVDVGFRLGRDLTRQRLRPGLNTSTWPKPKQPSIAYAGRSRGGPAARHEAAPKPSCARSREGSSHSCFAGPATAELSPRPISARRFAILGR